jgi:hypothetical protein
VAIITGGCGLLNVLDTTDQSQCSRENLWLNKTVTLLYVFASQEDKDLVHEFVQNDGLACLIKVGSEADQNYQNYILRGEYLVVFLSSC